MIDEYNKLKTRLREAALAYTVLSTASFRRLFFYPFELFNWLLPTQSYYQNEKNYRIDVFLTFFAHANDSEPGSQYLKAQRPGTDAHNIFLPTAGLAPGFEQSRILGTESRRQR